MTNLDIWLITFCGLLVCGLIVTCLILWLKCRQCRTLCWQLTKADAKLDVWKLACNRFPAFTFWQDDKSWWICVMNENGDVLTKANNPNIEACILQADAQLRKDTVIGVGGAGVSGKPD